MLTRRLIVTVSAALVAFLCALAPGFGNDDDQGQGPPPPPPPGAGGPHRGEGRPPGGPMGQGWMLGEEQIDAIIEVLKDADPEAAAKVEKARKNNLREVRETIAPKGNQLFQMVQLKKTDPEIYALRIEEYKLNRKIEGIAEGIRKAGSDAKVDPELEKELKELLTKQFDLRQQTREKELQRLEKKVLEVREGINRRKADKERILRERLKTLTEKPADKDW